MKYSGTISYVNVIGRAWQGNTAAMQYPINRNEIKGDVTRESVADWADTHSGDFETIIDFSASIEDGENTIDIEWADDSNEGEYQDIMHDGGCY